MKLVFIAHWSSTSLQVRNVSIIIGDNQGSLKLSGVAGIDTEITAQLHWATHSLRDIDEGTIAEHRTIKCRIEVITIRNDCSQIFLHQVGMFLYGLTNTTEDDTLLTEFLLESSLH